jgi:hypothetical protein
MSDLSHTIVVKPNLFLRLFIWFWDTSGQSLNTCLLFWGTLGMLILWPLRLGVEFAAFVASSIPARQRNFADISEETASKPSEPKPPSRLFRLLSAFGHKAGAFWFKFQTPLTWTFRILVGLAILALAVYAVYGLSTVAWSWAILLKILVTIAAAAGVIIFGIVLAFVADKYSRRRRRSKRHTIRRIYRSVHDHTCANVVVENTNTGSVREA